MRVSKAGRLAGSFSRPLCAPTPDTIVHCLFFKLCAAFSFIYYIIYICIYAGVGVVVVPVVVVVIVVLSVRVVVLV